MSTFDRDLIPSRRLMTSLCTTFMELEIEFCGECGLDELYCLQEWVPIIRQDQISQRKIKAQPPLSDAYLYGMPAKRRKVNIQFHAVTC